MKSRQKLLKLLKEMTNRYEYIGKPFKKPVSLWEQVVALLACLTISVTLLFVIALLFVKIP